MARVAVLIDRAASCPDWKGAIAWALVDALAESQHELQIFTTLPPELIEPTHPRVSIARPAPSFGVETLPRWARALSQYRPDVVHTFAPRATGRWPKLTCWPYIEALSPLLPRAHRVATIFEPSDVSAPAAPWIESHRAVTSLIDGANLFDLLPPSAPAAGYGDEDDRAGHDDILIPAPVDEWADRDGALAALTVFLREDPTRRVRIVGGWGDLARADRRRTWTALADFTARVHLSEPLRLTDFVREARHARGLWRDCLRPGSWRAHVGALVAGERPGGEDVVNQLSRIYSAPGRW